MLSERNEVNRHLKHKRYTLLKSTCTSKSVQGGITGPEALRWSSRFMTGLQVRLAYKLASEHSEHGVQEAARQLQAYRHFGAQRSGAPGQ